MAGDWVQFHHKGVKIVSETAPRCKTVDVDNVGQITRVYVDINDENGEFVVKTLPNEYEKEAGLYVMRGFVLNPVPLTAEILEKNGFKLHAISEIYELVSPKKDWFVAIGFKDGCIDWCRVRRWGNEYLGSIKYVHELQHALRLFKVNKEIEL